MTDFDLWEAELERMRAHAEKVASAITAERERFGLTAPCPCECNVGGFCGGCGHAGCGHRS
jgi:hypothetical protein